MSSNSHECPTEIDDFCTLITREQDFLRALSTIMGVPRCDAPDVLQEANLYMVQHQASFTPGTNFRAWASQVLRYRVLQYFRNHSRSQVGHLSEEALEAVAADAGQHFDTYEPRLHRLRHCLQRLTAPQLQLLGSVYTQGKNLKQLAAEGGLSHMALRKTISRIRSLLKSCIEQPHSP